MCLFIYPIAFNSLYLESPNTCGDVILALWKLTCYQVPGGSSAEKQTIIGNSPGFQYDGQFLCKQWQRWGMC